MTRVLSIEEIHRWLSSHFTRGWTVEKMLAPRDLPQAAFCRTVGLDRGDLSRFIHNQKPLSPRVQRNVSKFILDWEAGMIEFERVADRRYRLVHRATPKRRPPRMTIAFDDGPKLRLISRLPASDPRIFLTAKAK